MLSGRRMPSSSANFSAGMILPRAMPAMSGMIASTSEIPWSRKNCCISLAIDHLSFGAAGRAEFGKQSSRERVIAGTPFRVPLHRERKLWCALDAKRLHHSVRCARFHGKTASELTHALGMERVHADPIGAGDAPQLSIGLEDHLVCELVLPLDRQRLVLAVIHVAGYLVQLLPQRAPEGDVHLLEAATNAEHRNTGRDRTRNQRQGGFIAMRIVQRALRTRLAAVMAWLDIGGTPHEQQPVERLEQFLELQLAADRRHQQRQTAGTIEHRSDILLASQVVRLVVLAEQASIRRNADDRTLRNHERIAPDVEAV